MTNTVIADIMVFSKKWEKREDVFIRLVRELIKEKKES